MSFFLFFVSFLFCLEEAKKKIDKSYDKILSLKKGQKLSVGLSISSSEENSRKETSEERKLKQPKIRENDLLEKTKKAVSELGENVSKNKLLFLEEASYSIDVGIFLLSLKNLKTFLSFLNRSESNEEKKLVFTILNNSLRNNPDALWNLSIEYPDFTFFLLSKALNFDESLLNIILRTIRASIGNQSCFSQRDFLLLKEISCRSIDIEIFLSILEFICNSFENKKKFFIEIKEIINILSKKDEWENIDKKLWLSKYIEKESDINL